MKTQLKKVKKKMIMSFFHYAKKSEHNNNIKEIKDKRIKQNS